MTFRTMLIGATAMAAASGAAWAQPAPVFADPVAGANDGSVLTTHFLNGLMAAPGGFTVPAVRLSSTSTAINNLSPAEPANGVFMHGAGNNISYCSIDGCVSTSGDHQRATGLFISTTNVDGQAQENTVGIETTVNKGNAPPWTASTAYAIGANVTDGANVYRATTGGTSAATGSGPTGQVSGIVDGTVVWAWINVAAINGKVGLYNAVHLMPGAGHSWAQANNLVVDAASQKDFFTNTEMDVTNNVADCAPGGGNCYDLYMSMNGSGTNTAWMALSGAQANATPSIFQAHYGVLFQGAQVAKDAEIADNSSGAAGLWFNNLGLGSSHSQASIVDNSTGPHSYYVSGNHTSSTWQDASNSPASMLVGGTHSTAVVYDSSTSPSAMRLVGSYATAAIDTTLAAAPNVLTTAAGQKVCFNTANGCLLYTPGAGLNYQVGGNSLVAFTDTGSVQAGSVLATGQITANTQMQLGTPTATGVTMLVEGAAGSMRRTYYQSGSSARWETGVGSAAETGANAGSNFYFQPHDDSGALLPVAISISRATGRVTALGGMQSGVSTTAALPVCNAAAEATRFGVSDASNPAWGITVVGGGTGHIGVYCNGSSWIAD